MKKIILLIGIAMVLMLCITPVAAVSGTDFEIVTGKEDVRYTCIYFNVNDPNERYIHLYTTLNIWICSLVTFKPANIPDAPVMVVDTTHYTKDVYLPHSVDEWEIKYYSSFWTHPTEPDPEYLDNAGTVNMKEVFSPWYINGGTLYFEHSSEVYIWGHSYNVGTGQFNLHKYYIPEV